MGAAAFQGDPAAVEQRRGSGWVSPPQSLLSWLWFWHFSWINTFPRCYQPLVHFQSFENFNLDLFGSGFVVFVEGEFSALLTKTAISSCHSLLMRVLISPESRVHAAWITEHRRWGNSCLKTVILRSHWRTSFFLPPEFSMRTDPHAWGSRQMLSLSPGRTPQIAFLVGLLLQFHPGRALWQHPESNRSQDPVVLLRCS